MALHGWTLRYILRGGVYLPAAPRDGARRAAAAAAGDAARDLAEGEVHGGGDLYCFPPGISTKGKSEKVVRSRASSLREYPRVRESAREYAGVGCPLARHAAGGAAAAD